MEHVCAPGEQRQAAEIPAEVARRHRKAPLQAEGVLLDTKAWIVLQLRQQLAHVPCRSRPSESERTRIERNRQHAVSVSEHAFVAAQDSFAAGAPRKAARVG